MKRLPHIVVAGFLAFAAAVPATAGNMDWIPLQKFEETMWPHRVDRGMQPRDLAVRVVNGGPEYKIIWQDYEGGFSDAIFPTQSREEAEGLIRVYADPVDAHLLGGDPKLCLHKFARAEHNGREFFLMYMVSPDIPGLRCISLPAK